MLRIIFMGTPHFAIPTLAECLNAGHDIAAVYTQPPRPAGRGKRDRLSPVHAFASEAGLPVFSPSSLRDQGSQMQFAALRAQVAVVVAYGLILPRPILNAPDHGCLNLHASKLPRWRGAAPIQRAIMAGDKETAVMVMRMAEELDTGPICLSECLPIGENQTGGQLHDILAECGASLMTRALAALERGSLHATEQSGSGVTYARKIDKSETRINFAQHARDVHNHIRGLSPFPGAWFVAGGEGKEERIKVLRAECHDQVTTSNRESEAAGQVLDEQLTVQCAVGAIQLKELQRAGKKPMATEEFVRGFALAPGTQLLAR
ncbi:MAG: methionyl-tRNA formyltransferase [Hyphomicrobiaceae bacterium]